MTTFLATIVACFLLAICGVITRYLFVVRDWTTDSRITAAAIGALVLLAWLAVAAGMWIP